MIHPDTEVRFISPEKGYGVVASKFIPKGTITWVQDDLDQIFKRDQISCMTPLIKQFLTKYSFRNKNGDYVLCWDNAKFVNHSFTPSCFSTSYDFEIAIRDIHPGEELTDDYGYLNVEEPFTCIDENVFRKTVYPDDLLRFHKEWDALLLEQSQEVLKKDQILLDFIPTKTWGEFMNAVYNPTQMRSILECYYEESSIHK
ncbi:SET domain-containing protein [Flavobacterium ginsengiterrae]|uniref:SET domain-containing protein n=1 Tax=Flavobacterium ginsengiterrae TaxID=871695 RepID=A0ABP7G4H3_9FLAO